MQPHTGGKYPQYIQQDIQLNTKKKNLNSYHQNKHVKRILSIISNTNLNQKWEKRYSAHSMQQLDNTKNIQTTGTPTHAAENVKWHGYFGKQFLRKLKTIDSVTQNYYWGRGGAGKGFPGEMKKTSTNVIFITKCGYFTWGSRTGKISLGDMLN